MAQWPPPGDTQLGIFQLASGLLMSTAGSSLGIEAAEEAVDKTLGSYERSDQKSAICECSRGLRHSESSPPCYKCSANTGTPPPSYRHLDVEVLDTGAAGSSATIYNDGRRQLPNDESESDTPRPPPCRQETKPTLYSSLNSSTSHGDQRISISVNSPADSRRYNKQARRSASSPLCIASGSQKDPTDRMCSGRRRSNLETLMDAFRTPYTENVCEIHSSPHSLSSQFRSSDSLLPSVLFIPK